MPDSEERGPLLREIRCDEVVLRYLTLKLKPAPERKPWEPAPFWGTPIIEDGDVPARVIRRVLSDGTTKDVEVMSEAQYELVRDMPMMLEFKTPPVPPGFNGYFRWGRPVAPITSPPAINAIWSPGF